jgi:transposase-like protein
MAALDNPIFTDKDKAREHLEAMRWPNGPVCPHCNNSDPASIRALKGKAHRAGLYQCAECREQFTVTVGTVFERSKIPLNKWLLATHLMTSSKKGMSAHQLHRMLGLTYKSAWFMAHRIREAMRDDVKASGPLGGSGKVVEVDETYIGEVETPRPRNKYAAPYTKGGRSGPATKRTVVGLVERGGKVRMFHVDRATAASVREIMVTNISRETAIHTDESRLYTKLGAEFGDHQKVNHSRGEYAREGVTTNTIEGVFSIFKRGMKGVYQHCAEKHMHRYLAEFAFRYNHRIALKIGDIERRDAALKGIAGKRLTYRWTDEAAHA